MSFNPFKIPYQVDDRYSKKVAYFSMEFAVHQPLKIYSGGLGFLAGSHLRSAYELRQNLIGIGILWKYGYYDQARNQDQTLQVTWMEKQYSFLEDTGIKFQITVHEHPVWVKVFYLNPETFKTAPLFLRRGMCWKLKRQRYRALVQLIRNWTVLSRFLQDLVLPAVGRFICKPHRNLL